MPIIKKELAQKNFTVHKNLCPRNAANRATNIVASCLYLVRGTTNIKNHKLIKGGIQQCYMFSEQNLGTDFPGGQYNLFCHKS